MSTKNRAFSNKFSLVECEGKYGLNNENNVVLYPVYNSICELDIAKMWTRLNESKKRLA